MSYICPECGGTMSVDEFDIAVCNSCGYSAETEELDSDAFWKETEEKCDAEYQRMIEEGLIEEYEEEIIEERYEQVFDELDQALDID